MPKLNYELNYIEWQDHCSHTTQEWREVTEAIHSPVHCFSVGYVLHEDDDVVVLGQTVHPNEDYEDKFTGDICILKKVILKRKKIKI